VPQGKTNVEYSTAVVSNLVAIRHMWRQAEFILFHIFGHFKDFELFVNYRVKKKNIDLLTL
jgi:hypothetical protein